MLILLVGPKGSGKSHIGRLLERELGVRFFHVEPLWMDYRASCREEGREPDIVEGVTRIHPHIDAALDAHSRVCVETTGASPDILNDLLRLGTRHGLVSVRIRASLETCLARIEARDPTHQIPMDREMIRKVHVLGENLAMDFDVTIDNEGADESEVVDRIRSVLASPGRSG